MRELKGDWKDLFNGFMLALDLRKMFLGLCAVLFTLVPLARHFDDADPLDPAEIEAHADLTADLLIRALEIHECPTTKRRRAT